MEQFVFLGSIAFRGSRILVYIHQNFLKVLVPMVINYPLLLMETICMKFQILFAGKNKNIVSLLSAELA